MKKGGRWAVEGSHITGRSVMTRSGGGTPVRAQKYERRGDSAAPVEGSVVIRRGPRGLGGQRGGKKKEFLNGAGLGSSRGGKKSGGGSSPFGGDHTPRRGKGGPRTEKKTSGGGGGPTLENTLKKGEPEPTSKRGRNDRNQTTRGRSSKGIRVPEGMRRGEGL